MYVHWRVNHAYRETTCKVTAGRIKLLERTRDAFDPKYLIQDLLFEKLFYSRTNRQRALYREPVLAVQYKAAGKPYSSEGYDAYPEGFRDERDAQRVLASFPALSSFPCWYDPAKPSTVVLSRQMRSSYLFGLLYLAGFFVMCGWKPRPEY